MVDASRLFDLLVGGAGQAETRAWPTAQGEQGGAAAPTPDVLDRAKGFLQQHGGSIAGGVAAGAITNLLLGSKLGREIGGEALKLGAAAVIGGLAYRAYTNYREGKAPAPAAGTLPQSPAQAVDNAHALILIRAMIAAALSDGALDTSERERIQGRLSALGLESEELRFLEQEIARPWSPAQFAAAIPSPQARSEVYLASLVAIDADTEAERAYLRYLAATLGLDDALIAHLEEAARAASGGSPSSTPRKLASG